MTHGQHPPVVYSQPDRIELLLDSITRLMTREPKEVFAHLGVQRSAQQLSTLVVRRTAEALAAAETPTSGELVTAPSDDLDLG
jgi:hypothetical protein